MPTNKTNWQVWLDKNHMIGVFDTEKEAIAWVARYAPECVIKVICKGCNNLTDILDMSEYNGQPQCEGCCENSYMFENSDDPHGKGWR